jgi:hypothetical protein
MVKFITKTCAFCTNSFQVQTNSASQIYCNKSCYLADVDRKKVRSRCLLCEAEIVSSSPRRFCTKSHAAQYNNSKRDIESRSKQRTSLLATLENKPKVLPKPRSGKRTAKQYVATVKAPKDQVPLKKRQPDIVGPYSIVWALKCAHSGELFYSRSRRKYSPKYQHLYSRDGKAMYKFTFNLFDYPDLFNLNLIKQHGWYSVGGKSRKPINKSGCSRDHKVSVTEAIANNYDPYYIKHPLNCELMLHVDNKIKHSRSSLAYAELIRMVDDYELNGGACWNRTNSTLSG